MRSLSSPPDTNPAPDTGLRHADGVTVDARVLVITADGTDASADAITETLRYLGTPFDVLNATTGPTLTPDYLAVADHGRYYGVVLDVGDLLAGNLSAFSDEEWMTLASYEARFGVRRAVMYAYPTDAYGLTSTGGGFDVATRPIVAHCTAAGAAVFVGANCAGPVAIDDGWAYGSQATDAATAPLLVDDAGTVYAATRTYPDGREALVLTFAQSPIALHTLQLGYGVVSWVTRGLFVGEHHVYLAPQIDDFFLASQLYPMEAGTYRITADELQAFTNWQNARQADPLTAQFRAAFAFNAFGAKPPGRDGLTDKALELGPTFAWINHTWDHTEMDAMGYAKAFDELSQNNQYGVGAGLSRYSRREPGHAQPDGPEERRSDARGIRRRYPAGGERCIRGLPGQSDAERRLLQRARAGPAPGPPFPDGSLFQRLAAGGVDRRIRDASFDARRDLRADHRD